MTFDSDFIFDRINEGVDHLNGCAPDLRVCVESKLNELALSYADDLDAKGDRELWDLVKALTTKFVANDYLSWAQIQTMAASVIIRELLRRDEVRKLES